MRSNAGASEIVLAWVVHKRWHRHKGLSPCDLSGKRCKRVREGPGEEGEQYSMHTGAQSP